MNEWDIHPKKLDAYAESLADVGEDAAVRALQVVRLSNGAFDVHGSAYARAYRVRDPHGVESCLRFWTSKPDPSFLRLYTAIGREVGLCERAQLPRAHLIDTAVRIDGEAIPAVVMEWIEGVPLADFINAHITDRPRLYSLAKALLAVFSRQNGLGVSHGDLRSSNILIRLESEQCHAGMIDLDSLRWAGGPTLPRVVGGNRAWDDLRRQVSATPLQHDYLDQAMTYLVVIAVAQRPARWTGPTDDFLTLGHLRDDPDKTLSALERQEGVTGLIASAVRDVTSERRPWAELAVALASRTPAVPDDEFWSGVFTMPGRISPPAPPPAPAPKPPVSKPASKVSPSRAKPATKSPERQVPRARGTAHHEPSASHRPTTTQRHSWALALLVVVLAALALGVVFYFRSG